MGLSWPGPEHELYLWGRTDDISPDSLYPELCTMYVTLLITWGHVSTNDCHWSDYIGLMDTEWMKIKPSPQRRSSGHPWACLTTWDTCKGSLSTYPRCWRCFSVAFSSYPSSRACYVSWNPPTTAGDSVVGNVHLFHKALLFLFQPSKSTLHWGICNCSCFLFSKQQVKGFKIQGSKGEAESPRMREGILTVNVYSGSQEPTYDPLLVLTSLCKDPGFHGP